MSFNSPEVVFETESSSFVGPDKKYILTSTKESFTLSKPLTKQFDQEDALQEITNRQNLMHKWMKEQNEKENFQYAEVNVTK